MRCYFLLCTQYIDIYGFNKCLYYMMFENKLYELYK